MYHVYFAYNALKYGTQYCKLSNKSNHTLQLILFELSILRQVQEIFSRGLALNRDFSFKYLAFMAWTQNFGRCFSFKYLAFHGLNPKFLVGGFKTTHPNLAARTCLYQTFFYERTQNSFFFKCYMTVGGMDLNFEIFKR